MPNFSKINLDVIWLWAQAAIITIIVFIIFVLIILWICKKSVPKELYELRTKIKELKDAQKIAQTDKVIIWKDE